MILQDNFKYCGDASCCSLRVAAEGTLSLQELLCTWKELVSKFRSWHQCLLRRVLSLCSVSIWIAVLKSRRLRCKQPFFLAPADSYHVPDSGLRTGWVGMDSSSPLSPLTSRTKTKGSYAFFFFFLNSAGICNEFLHSLVINNTYYNF